MPDFQDHHDFLSTSTSLRKLRMKREFFDPTNKDHLSALKHYMETGNWTLQFYPEAPYIDVPMTVLRKFAGMHLDVLVTEAQKEPLNLTVQSADDGKMVIKQDRYKTREKS